jgi:putative ABC transport system substrate-binding protein
MKIPRRNFVGLVGATVAWPLAARAQQPAMPVIGYLGVGTPESQANTVAGVRKGLSDAGYVEGRNVAIEFLWAESQYNKLPAHASDVVRRGVKVIFANSPSAVRAVMAATGTIPIVFIMGEDPIKEGIVPSPNRPGGNVIGIVDYSNQLAGKLLGLLCDTVPKATVLPCS